MALCFSRRKRKKNRKDRHLLMMKVVSDVSRRTKNVQLRSWSMDRSTNETQTERSSFVCADEDTKMKQERKDEKWDENLGERHLPFIVKQFIIPTQPQPVHVTFAHSTVTTVTVNTATNVWAFGICAQRVDITPVWACLAFVDIYGKKRRRRNRTGISHLINAPWQVSVKLSNLSWKESHNLLNWPTLAVITNLFKSVSTDTLEVSVNLDTVFIGFTVQKANFNWKECKIKDHRQTN